MFVVIFLLKNNINGLVRIETSTRTKYFNFSVI